jgi:GH15 family glucan-1,4-alpha-glucosidase
MIRRILAVRGQMRFFVDVAPRFDYARARQKVALTPQGALLRSPELELSLSTSCPLEIADGRDVRARIELRAGETATFVLDRVDHGEPPAPHSHADIASAFDATVAFWRGWLSRSRYSGRWRETVHRSALTLKRIDGREDLPRRSSRTWKATWARRRCGSATGLRPSCSSTSTAS